MSSTVARVIIVLLERRSSSICGHAFRIIGFRAESSVEARFVSDNRDSKTGSKSRCSVVASSERSRSSGRIAEVKGRGVEPPNTCDGFVLIRIRASAWAVVRLAVLLSCGNML